MTQPLKVRGKSARGQAIAEMGPALFLIVVMFFVPAINLVSLAFSYSACAALNQLQLREAAFLPAERAKHPAGPVLKGIVESWMRSGLGAFVRVTELPRTTVEYSDGERLSGDIVDKSVRVTTTVVVSPLAPLPFFTGVPALGAPTTLVVSSARQVENPTAFN